MRKTTSGLALVTFLTLAWIAFPAWAEPARQTQSMKTIDVADQLQLFLDDTLIDAMKGLELRLQHPRPAEIVLRKDKPWEDNYMFDPVVIKDGDRYRMWYRAGWWQDAAGPKTYGWPTAYAESTDGVVWTKPSLGLIEFKQSKDNNLLWRADKGQDAANTFSVIKDANPQCLEEERYKAIACPGFLDNNIAGLVSSDGINWKMKHNPMIKGKQFDSHNILLWDQARKQYVIYARGWTNPYGRFIRRSVSSDFQNWSKFEFIHVGKSAPEQLYKNGATCYYRRPDLILMFPKRFVENRDKRKDPGYEPERDWSGISGGLSDIVFMFSYDGLHFDRRYMEAFIRPGRDRKNWHDRTIYSGTTLVPTGNGEMSLYMMENYKCPTVHIRRMVLREDGFVAVHAGCPGGEMTTKPFTFKGRALVLNYATSAAGSISIEVQDGGGKPLPGFELANAVEMYGDDLDRKAAWKGNPDLGSLAGKPVRLHFAMKDADLYSIRFVPK